MHPARPELAALGRGFRAMAYGNQKDGALAGCVRGEELDYVVIEKCQAGGAQALCVSCEIKFAADDTGFELDGAVSAIAEALQDGIQVGQEEDINGGVGGQSLLQSQVSGLRTKIPCFRHSSTLRPR